MLEGVYPYLYTHVNIFVYMFCIVVFLAYSLPFSLPYSYAVSEGDRDRVILKAYFVQSSNWSMTACSAPAINITA